MINTKIIDAQIRFGVEFKKLPEQNWAFGFEIIRAGKTFYLIIGLLKWVFSIGKMYCFEGEINHAEKE